MVATMTDELPDGEASAARLVESLIDRGDLSSTEWAEALRDVPREFFVPDRAIASPDIADAQPYPIDRIARPVEWREAVYSDTSIITQLDDGAVGLDSADAEKVAGAAYTSSASAPGVLVGFLETLNPREGDRVLEIGTGTGWNAALLAHRLGEQNVTTIEIDPGVAQQARRNLRAADVNPRAIVADGEDGAKSWGPYDRVLSTAGVARIPYEWVAQTRIGGKIVAPFSPGFGYGHKLVLDVIGHDMAVGRFVGPAGYMMLRSHRSERAPHGAMGPFIHHEDEADKTFTELDPRQVTDAGPGADLAISALVSGVRCMLVGDGGDGTGEATLWLVETRAGTRQNGSWAVAEYAPGREHYEVEQYGERRLWDEVSDAYLKWLTWGSPGHERFGYTFTDGGQAIWLDYPSRAVNGGAGSAVPLFGP